MGQVRHGSATTTHAVRAAIQRSQASLSTLSRELGINPKTVAKWRKRATVEDLKTGPKAPHSTTLTQAEEAAVVAFRRHTLLPLDDCLYALQPSIPHLTRSALHRCLQRHGISRLPDIEGDKPKRQRFKRYPIGFFHMDIAEVQHRLTKPNHPWTNGQVERMNRTIKEATVTRFHYESHEQLRVHLADFMAAYNFARRLKTLSGLTPYEYIAKIWTAEPDRFIVDPIHQMPGLNT
ncbi:integrase core domain-containing protein [Sphingomonas faeni]|uniref:integrase core domain-containing protein n=1 Tax=Sphingomonas faeni TaxID=185950 RepID=UPI002783ACB7|nr:integrase core domain-containing protein [Sphingomonas faeni]MDQ0839868.1 transposase InsO family protein [Sphingomonas faeni]